jgi:hypothetical protein
MVTVSAPRAVGTGKAYAPTIYGVAITATPVPDGAPAPYMDVALTGLSGDEMSVYRTAEGRRTLVRGYKRQAVVGSAFALSDYEAPFGTPVVYDVEVYDVSNVLIDAGVSTGVTLDVDVTWIADPLHPSVSAAVNLGGMALSAASYARSGGPVEVSGATLPAAVTGVRRAAAGVPLTFKCESVEEMSATLTLLRAADPLVVRTPAGYPILPRLAYVTCPDWALDVPPQGDAPSLFIIRGVVSLVQAPAASVLVPVRTYGTVAATYSSYSDVLASVSPSTYLELLRG